MKADRRLILATAALSCALLSEVRAHPHVFVEANIDIVRDADGNFTELRQVWRFDELFSTVLVLDFDRDGDQKLNQAEMKEVAYFDTYPPHDAAGFPGAWNVFPFFDNGLVIVSDINRGVFILRPDLPERDLIFIDGLD